MGRINDFLIEQQDKRYKKKISSEVAEIRNLIENHYNNFSEKEIIEEFHKVKNEPQDIKLKRPRIYALAARIIDYTLGLKLYDVQIQGAIALSDRNVAEMRTGEGKTVTVSLPTILQASTGDSVHVVTVNEYLAKRDKEILENVYKKLGFSVDLNLNSLSRAQKQKVYKSDIVYSTANELGFDYLNDNMVMTIEDKVNQRGYNFALIDEVDLVLIDEARTPLIIGSEVPDKTGEIIKANLAVSHLTKDDYEVDLKSFAVKLTKSGEAKLNEFYETESIYSEDKIEIMHKIHQALIANFLYKKDIDYAITRGKSSAEITIVDSFTGRLQHGRRFTRGLHQAIEAKHFQDGVKIKNETQTVATITLQNFFRLYKQISGMSGTVTEERQEFIDTYGLSVVKIDPNKPLIRVDKPMEIFSSKNQKWEKIVQTIIKYHNEGNPILVGTVSVEDSELVSKMLNKHKIKHQVLNAKQDAKEASIISEAGRKNTITIATNMAGRGTDIKVEEGYQLVVILTELNDSERIDNQLKGRTSRQGAPGTTETIISLEDTIFTKAAIAERLKRFQVSGPLPKQFGRLIRNVQEELENVSYSSRKNSLRYDDIIREQRNIFYNTREQLLSDTDGTYINKYLEKVLNEEELTKLKKVLDNSNSDKIKTTRTLLLSALDKSWVEHIDKLDVLKTGIGWRAQSGHNPLIIYQNEAKILYDDFKKQVYSTIKENIHHLSSASEIKTENPYKGVRR